VLTPDRLLLAGLLLTTAVWVSVLLAPSKSKHAPRGQLAIGLLYLLALGIGGSNALKPFVPIDPSGISSEVPTTGGASWVRVNQVTTLVAFLLSLVLILRASAPHKDRLLLWSSLAFSGSAIVSATIGPKPGYTRALFFFPILTIALWVVRISFADLLKAWRRIFGGFVWASLAFAVLRPNLAHFTGNGRTLAGFDQLSGLAGHPNAMGLLGVVALALEVVPQSRRQLLPLHVAAPFVAILLAQSRAAWVATLLVGILILGRSRRERLYTLGQIAFLMGIIVIGTILLLSSQVQQNLGQTFGSRDVQTLNGRTTVWRDALDAFQRDPVTGYGPTVFSPDYRHDVLGIPSNSAFGFAHDQALQTLAERGVIGILALSFYVFCIFRSRRKASLDERRLISALMLVLIPAFLTEAPLQAYGPTPAVLVHLCLLSLAFAASETSAHEGMAKESRITSRVPAVDTQ
jgi:O-antigen ligase